MRAAVAKDDKSFEKELSPSSRPERNLLRWSCMRSAINALAALAGGDDFCQELRWVPGNTECVSIFSTIGTAKRVPCWRVGGPAGSH
jgi:hypothetical protein